MSALDRSLRDRGHGLHPAPVGAQLYERDGMEYVTLVTPEEEAIQFLLDGLGVPTIQELHRLVELGRRVEAGVAFR